MAAPSLCPLCGSGLAAVGSADDWELVAGPTAAVVGAVELVVDPVVVVGPVVVLLPVVVVGAVVVVVAAMVVVVAAVVVGAVVVVVAAVVVVDAAVVVGAVVVVAAVVVVVAAVVVLVVVGGRVGPTQVWLRLNSASLARVPAALLSRPIVAVPASSVSSVEVTT